MSPCGPCGRSRLAAPAGRSRPVAPGAGDAPGTRGPGRADGALRASDPAPRRALGPGGAGETGGPARAGRTDLVPPDERLADEAALPRLVVDEVRPVVHRAVAGVDPAVGRGRIAPAATPTRAPTRASAAPTTRAVRIGGLRTGIGSLLWPAPARTPRPDPPATLRRMGRRVPRRTDHPGRVLRRRAGPDGATRAPGRSGVGVLRWSAVAGACRLRPDAGRVRSAPSRAVRTEGGLELPRALARPILRATKGVRRGPHEA